MIADVPFLYLIDYQLIEVTNGAEGEGGAGEGGEDGADLIEVIDPALVSTGSGSKERRSATRSVKL